MINIGMPCYFSILALLITMVPPAFCKIRELKWLENTDRAGLTFPDPMYVRYNSSVLHCIAMCSSTEGCDGVTFSASTLVCRGHALADVIDVSNGVASPGTRIWTNGNCRRIDYLYVESLDWCIKLTSSLILMSRDAAKRVCMSEQARLVNVDSKAKHDVLVTKLFLPVLLWWISGSKVSGVWQWDDGTPISLDTDLWNPLPPVPFLSNCLCYFGNLFWPCICTSINGIICEEV